MEAHALLKKTVGVVQGTLGAPGVLATLVGAEGHSYRKPGAMMLILADGSRLGSLSPGCMEEDLQLRAALLAQSGEYEVVTYDLRAEEDPVWGEWLGCGGVVQVLLEPLGEALRTSMEDALRLLEAGREALWLRFTEGNGFRYKMMDAEEADGGRSEIAAAAWSMIRLRPSPRLVLFGAGSDAEPIGALAAQAGFRVAVGDWRSAIDIGARFPHAEATAIGDAKEIVRALRVRESDYVVLCSHQLRRDREMLEAVLPCQPKYLGVMGSSSRILLLFEGLSIPRFVKAPVGLPIGAEGPQQIAISIAAELLAVYHGRDKGGERDARFGDLFGGGQQFPHGGAEAFLGVCPG